MKLTPDENDALAEAILRKLKELSKVTQKGVDDWINAKKSESAKFRRAAVIESWVKANGKSSPVEVLEDIRAHKLDMYESVKKYLASLPETLAISTKYLYRSLFPNFFETMFGTKNFDRVEYDTKVTLAEENYVATTKAVPKPEEIRQMLRVAGPRDRALLGFLACTGMRIREVLHRKMTELVRHKGYASIVLQAGQTKARVKRIVFLTQEVVDWIDLYHKQPEVSGNQWIFPGETHRNSKNPDAPISYSAAHTAIAELFQITGLVEKEGEIYSPHSFRTFTDSQMAKCGLDRKYIAIIIGHKSKLGAEASYADRETIESEWREKCLKDMTRLSEEVVVVKSDPKLEKKVTRLEGFNKKLLAALFGDTKFEGLTTEERINRAKRLLGEEEQELESKSDDRTATSN